MSTQRDDDRRHLLAAMRLGYRGRGGCEPNPPVGCVIVAPDGTIAGDGYHRRCGEAHAEIVALMRAGDRAAGATCYVTLEPCNHTGRTGPCSEALIEAKIARVVIGRRDPNPQASGGIKRLQEAGIEVCVIDDIPGIASLTDPFVHRITTGRPWVVVKWAQTIDGCIATRTGQSQWISNEQSRQLVHRERGKVDVILTGIGTVLADDPQLTARNIRPRPRTRPRRIARRVVIDPKLQIPLDSKLVRSAQDVPLIVACNETLLMGGAEKVDELRSAGVELIGIPLDATEVMPLAGVLEELTRRYEATNVLVEAGPGLLGRLFEQNLVNEAWVFIAPMLLGDEQAKHAVVGNVIEQLGDATKLHLISQRRRGDDIILRYRVSDIG